MSIRKNSCAAVFLTLFLLTVPIQADVVEYVLPWTGVSSGGGGDGMAKYATDQYWKSAYLGDFGIGVTNDDPTQRTHNGKQVVNVVTDPSKQVALSDIGNAAMNAYNSGAMRNAFVYNTNEWPINNPWVSPGANDETAAVWSGDNTAQYYDNAGHTSNAAGYYAYNIDFALGESAEYYLYGSLITDNALIGVMLDGQYLNFSYEGSPLDAGIAYGSWDNFIVNGTLSLDEGFHSLIFLVSNFAAAGNDGNPTGIFANNLALTTVPPSTVPEPASMLIFGIGLVGACFVTRRRMKK